MKIKKFWIILGMFLLSLTSVYSQSILDPLNIFQGINLAAFYAQNNLWIDAVIYFIIFIGVAAVTIGKKFQDSGGKAIVIGIGLALSFGITYFTWEIGFSLIQLGPWALILFMILIAYTIFSTIKYMGEDSLVAIAIAYILVWLMLNFVLKEVMETYLGELVGWGWLIFAVSLIYVLVHFVKMLRGSGEGRSSSDGGNSEVGSSGSSGREPREERERRPSLLGEIGEGVRGRLVDHAVDQASPENVARFRESRRMRPVISGASNGITNLQNLESIMVTMGREIEGMSVPSNQTISNFSKVFINLRNNINIVVLNLNTVLPDLIQQLRANFQDYENFYNQGRDRLMDSGTAGSFITEIKQKSQNVQAVLIEILRELEENN
tara:strand:+ start:362 stop:1498 length:1137 start_codon:yes stop_codon:yes gene_type:complete